MQTSRKSYAQDQSSSLNEKVVLMTGASTGIGRELAKGLSESGATVVSVRCADRLEEFVTETSGSKAASSINIVSSLALVIQARESAYRTSKGAVAELIRSKPIDLMNHQKGGNSCTVI